MSIGKYVQTFRRNVVPLFSVICSQAMAKGAFFKKRALFTSTLDLKLRNKLGKYYIWSIAFYGAENWKLRAVDQKHLESFEMWCWRRMEKISKEKVKWIDHILRRNCPLQ